MGIHTVAYESLLTHIQLGFIKDFCVNTILIILYKIMKSEISI